MCKESNSHISFHNLLPTPCNVAAELILVILSPWIRCVNGHYPGNKHRHMHRSSPRMFQGRATNCQTFSHCGDKLTMYAALSEIETIEMYSHGDTLSKSFLLGTRWGRMAEIRYLPAIRSMFDLFLWQRHST